LYLAVFFLEGEIFQTNEVEKSKHAFYYQKHFPEILAIYEKKWKQIAEPDRPQMTKYV
jgi:hypothetical protein